MAKWLDKVKYFVGIGDEDEEEYESDESTGGTAQPTAQSLYPTASSSSTGAERNSKLVSVPKLTTGTEYRDHHLVVIVPKRFEDGCSVVNHIKQNRPVVLNTENVDKELSVRVFDFCSGALYALGGHIQQVSRDIFILAPQNVDVSGDVKKDIESKGNYTWSTPE